MEPDRIRRLVIIGALAITTTTATAITFIALNSGAGMGQPRESVRVDPSSDAVATGGISATAAADLARSHVADGAVFVSAVAGKYRDVFNIGSPADRHLDTPDRLVWAVTFNADFEICPPNGSPCWSPRPGQTQVILDYVTGGFLESGSFAPA